MQEADFNKSQAELLLPSDNLPDDIGFFETLGFSLDQIFPSDDPQVARMSGRGMCIRLDKGASTAPATIYLLIEGDPQPDVVAPNGTIVRFVRAGYQLERPATQHYFATRRIRDSDPWVIGRAGMLYRDLIPDRLGGSIIASHIRIPDAGPVPDVVHYHTVGFQLIYCYRGWVRLVYEDQGPPFILHAGDCVTQPPGIRHRVLEASEGLEVIELAVPADHMTTIDHDMGLPTSQVKPDREFDGQRFCHHRANEADWQAGGNGFKVMETGVDEATRGLARVRVLESDNSGNTGTFTPEMDINFTFVLDGELHVTAEGHASTALSTGDAFVVPPGMTCEWHSLLAGTRLLEVGIA